MLVKTVLVSDGSIPMITINPINVVIKSPKSRASRC
jgi:hypothetical protein